MGAIIIKIEILKPGKQFKNYKVMCQELGIEVKKSSDTKKAQFRELERYCTYNKVGHLITIDQVYETPLEKRKRKGNNTVYGDIMQILILDLLAQKRNSGNLIISKSKFLRELNLVNLNYSHCFKRKKALSIFCKVDRQVVNDFYYTTNDSFKRAIELALKTLQNKRLIICNTVTKVSKNGMHSLASPDEKRLILFSERSTMLSLGYTNLKSLRISKDWKEFCKKSKKLLKELGGIDFYYSAYEITQNDKYLKEESDKLLDFLLNKLDRQRHQNELNAKACKKLAVNGSKRHETESELPQQKGFRLEQSYSEDIKKLIDIVIKDNAKIISKEILELEEIDELDFEIEYSLPDGL
ncbi:hypothetical protein [Bacillus altitudinis]|uniref:hypothetical protein n=1 Tax=Bacillus altitudinis TaxID=293387 RepID=UPI00148EC87A|nr:hypothetical protein [Bacillus altitudinis]NOL32667.1 hypothetical protein [Bacillus altitudinis]